MILGQFFLKFYQGKYGGLKIQIAKFLLHGKNLAILRDFGQTLDENVKNSKNTKIIKKCRDGILDNIILYNLAKFQFSRSF